MNPGGKPTLLRDGRRLRVVPYDNLCLTRSDLDWRDTEDSERRMYPTHVRIFGAAMKYLSTLGPSAKLRLYHEMTVAAADEQFFESTNCHPRTGMLGAVEPISA